MAAGMQMPMQVMPMGVAQPGMQQWAGQAYVSKL